MTSDSETDVTQKTNHSRIIKKKALYSLFLVILFVLQPFSLAQSDLPQPDEAAVKRLVDEAMAKLTWEQKVAQISGIRLNNLIENGTLSEQKCRERIPHGIGHVSQFSSCVPFKPDELAAVVAELQQFIIAHNNASIPAIFHEEAITGMAARGATTYPQQINVASSWNPELIKGNAATTARNMRAIGATQALSPMLDVIDDARWGRSEEGFGEDPYLAAVMGSAFIRGLQGDDLRTGAAATAKHFAGYGNSVEDLGLFHDEVLLPHEAAVRIAGVSCMMPGYHAYRGEPCSSSSLLLTDILRREFGFEGPIVSDYGAMGQVQSQYQKAATPLEAGIRCLKAGMDVELPEQNTYRDLAKAVEQGDVPAALVDAAVRRQLILKARLGLLDGIPKPASAIDLDPPQNRQRAYTTACQGVILLKNTGVLPLDASVQSIAVVGPNADSYYSLLGDYTYQMMMEFWWRTPVDTESPRLVTLLTGLREQLPDTVTVAYERGCDWTKGLDPIAENTGAVDPRLHEGKRLPLEKTPPTDPEAAVRLAADSDLIIAAMGENRYLCGEGVDCQDVRLPGEQESFIKRLAATGKPIVLVVFGGRPMVLTDIEPLCSAVIYAWYPGQAGGTALADIIRGKVNPAGRLTMTLPRSMEQVPTSYRRGYKADDPPLYPFGYGLTYTRFAYAELHAPASVKTSDEAIFIRFKLKNQGRRAGTEICQVYLRRPDASNALAKQELKGFARVELEPGASQEISVDLPLEFIGRSAANGELTIAPGTVEIMVGASAADIRLRSKVAVTGPAVKQPHRQAFFSRTTLH